MVLASEARLPDPEAFLRELRRSRAVSLDQAGEAMLACEVEGEPSLVGLVPVPIPWSQLEGPCATAWWWPEAEAVCKPCPAHFIVTTQSADGNVFTANLRLTAIISALISAARAPAVYWGAGTVIRSAADFCEEAARATREFLPLRLWIDFRVQPEGESDFLFATTGLAAFGLLEIETIAPRAKVDHVLARIFNAAHYLCDHGPVLLDGQTFGLNPTEKIGISHRPSRWDRKGKVIFLEFP
jgi:hypothetical protein